MSDELNRALSGWAAPPLSAEARERVEALLESESLPGPARGRQGGGTVLRLAYAAVVAALVVSMVTTREAISPALTQHHITASPLPVVAPGIPAEAQVAGTAVSIVNLKGYEPIRNPRIHVVRSQH